MAWDGLNRAQICRNIQDPSKNGNRRGTEQVIEHMGRSARALGVESRRGAQHAGMSHEDFINAQETSAAAGGPCPAGASSESGKSPTEK